MPVEVKQRLGFTGRFATTLLAFLLPLVMEAAYAQSETIPSLEQLSGQWQKASSLRSLPAMNNTQGAARVMSDLVSIENVSFPPLTMSGETGGVFVNGRQPALDETRWFPYQVLRRGAAEGIAIESSTRMMYSEQGFLFRLTLSNPGSSAQSVELKIKLSASTSLHRSWGWNIPRDGNQFSAAVRDEGRSLVLRDAQGALANCFSFARKPDRILVQGDSGIAIWRVDLKPHSSANLDYVLVLGARENEVRTLAGKWARDFQSAFEQVQRDWQARFEAMFTPNNKYFSGHLPLLVTDDEKLRRVYYMSVVSLLATYRTSFPLAPRVYVSNAPEYNNIMVYFWDTREWATVLALLDPAMLKEYLRQWLSKDIHQGYAEEFLTGSLQGPWYSANDFSVFLQLDTYLNVTGDHAFLSEKIGRKTVLEHMEVLATYWKTLVRPGRMLADYGEAPNLLECVPTYIHEVPSFNAANVWMMRRVAAMLETEGNPQRAGELRSEAKTLLAAVLDLYEPGQGVWDSLHRDGKRVQMHHVFDFATVGATIAGDLSEQTRREMTGFVEKELLTDHWMRAQSLTDPAAGHSDRPDHGPMGAFSAWPAETIAVMNEFGEYDKALDFLHRIAEVTAEGPFSQSRELLGNTSDAPVRIARRGDQDYYVSSGASFAETIIREFFGYQPDWVTHAIVANRNPRGFEGQLLNLSRPAHRIDIRSTRRGLEVEQH
jgi:hypothetical protein